MLLKTPIKGTNKSAEMTIPTRCKLRVVDVREVEFIQWARAEIPLGLVKAHCAAKVNRGVPKSRVAKG